MDKNRYPVHLGLFTMAYYITNAIYQSFISIYYQNAGLDSGQRGLIMAGISLVSIFSQIFWGNAGDCSKSRARLLRILCVCAAGVMLAYRSSAHFAMLLPLACAFSVFYTSIQPMGESVILDRLQKTGAPFGPIRWMGSACFAVCAMLMGGYFTGSRIERFPLVVVIALLVTLCSTFALPSREERKPSATKRTFAALLKYRPLLKLLLFLTPLQLTMGYFYAFYSTYFTSLPGGNESLLGWCYFISAMSETPFLWCADRLFKRFGAGKLLCASAFFLTIRWLILAFAQSAYPAMAAQALHSGCFIVMVFAMAKYVTETVPPDQRASGQMLISVVGFGIARVAGSSLGGQLANAFGEQAGFLVCAGLTFLSLVIFAPSYLKKPPLNGSEAKNIPPVA